MANIREVARRAGVGVGTVSRAINNSGYVAEDTKKRILEAMEETGYEPADVSKYGKRTGLVGVMVPNLEHPFFAKIMKNMEYELSIQGFKCVVCNTADVVNRQKDFMIMLEENVIDGLITCVDPIPGFSGRRGKPIVSMDRHWAADVPLIRSDHAQGGRIVADVFLKSGCKRIIQFAGGHGTRQSANLRHEVMEEILTQNGCEVVTINMRWDAMSYAYNKEIILQYWDMIEHADGCMTNDIGAMTCLAVAQKMGIEVPQQFKIIGYDGTEITNLSYPELSVIEQDCPALARECVRTVSQMIKGEKPDSMQVLVPVHWKQRGTT